MKKKKKEKTNKKTLEFVQELSFLHTKITQEVYWDREEKKKTH